MTEAGLAAAEFCSAQVRDVVLRVRADQWELPSACPGWRAIDVMAHLGALAFEAVHPPTPDPTWPDDRERYHDMRVDQRRSWTHDEVLAEWRCYTPRQLEVLASAQSPQLANDIVDVTGLGTYPRHLMANMMAFNVLCHLRFDLLGPDGPLPVHVPDPTDDIVAPAVEFMLAGIPQMQGWELGATVRIPLVLDLTGPGAMTVTVMPADRAGRHLTVSPGAHGTTRITSSALDFIAWATTRKSWRSYCSIEGDAGAAVPFLNCLNII
jgi:uncharacterized protein (TIGR03083 family)